MSDKRPSVTRVVKYIRKGVGISYTDVEYADSTSNSVAPTSGWKTTAPAWQNGHYIWTRTHTVYTNGADNYSAPVRIPSGKGIASIVEQYYQSSSATELKDGSWIDNNAPTWKSGWYIWTRSKITYTDGNVQYTDALNPTGQTGNGVNPNILLRTIFDNGINPVKQAWNANWSYVGIDVATDTIVQGRKCVRINAGGLSDYLDFKQNVYGRIKASTWYTLSFNYFSTAAWHFFIYNTTDSTSVIDMSAGYIVDGEAISISRIDGYLNFAGNWQGKRHTITFKTRSSFSNAYAYILFRAPADCQLAICMPKLEEGKAATAYIAHESDLKGDPGNPGSPGGQGPRGYRGPGLRGPQDWALMDIDYQFYKGDESTQEPYEDFVVYNGNYYKCVKSHTKTSYNYPGSTADTSNGYWQLSDKLAMVAANVLFANHGYFGSAIISGDWLISTNGTIDGDTYTKNDTYNSIVPYSLFNPDNPLGNPILKFSSNNNTYTFTASDSTKNISTVTLQAGKVYKLSVTGKAGSSSGQYYVRLRNTSTGATHTPVMINGTDSTTRSGVFTAGASANYYLEVYNSAGLSGTITAVTLNEMNFAPTYALDLLTGKTYQADVYMSGYVYKRKLKLTNANKSRYVIDSGFGLYLDVLKVGQFVEFASDLTEQINIAMPYMDDYTAPKYSEKQKDECRELVGNTLIVYNRSNYYVAFTGKLRETENGASVSFGISKNHMAYLECKIKVTDGYEEIYWLYKTASIR